MPSVQVVPRDVAGGMRPSDCHATDCKFEERLLEKTAAVDAHNGDDDGDDDDDDDATGVNIKSFTISCSGSVL